MEFGSQIQSFLLFFFLVRIQFNQYWFVFEKQGLCMTDNPNVKWKLKHLEHKDAQIKGEWGLGDLAQW